MRSTWQLPDVSALAFDPQRHADSTIFERLKLDAVNDPFAALTVDDDETIVPDLAGWQACLCDDEDLHLLSQALKDKTQLNVGNLVTADVTSLAVIDSVDVAPMTKKQ